MCSLAISSLGIFKNFSPQLYCGTPMKGCFEIIYAKMCKKRSKFANLHILHSTGLQKYCNNKLKHSPRLLKLRVVYKVVHILIRQSIWHLRCITICVCRQTTMQQSATISCFCGMVDWAMA